ncbi:HNH nuclease [uncultured Caudovirales phage]|uniref:HNH nuclease n=1 Tax=uncultured Caudovirales phage TaxID=2100421 RepID=A0A6J5Q9F3_9CAUD|nr:HNH nuclease [uncultured Caudovirales phage]CAB4179036.1 HNH nuclease [uncultured Caudovirales phage]CAB4188601.1 HNH nuclease [uncultured Caudovirales phage]CAB4220399.1 HNH nuclease [uncultured Caudovirales phage]
MENFIKIKGYENYYISNKGNVKSTKYNKEIILKPKISKFGYHRVVLQENNVVKAFLIHRLVALSFIKNSENKPQINHINGIKSDNRIENLEWCTALENMNHSLLLGRNSKGVKIIRIDSNLNKKVYNKIILASKDNGIHPTAIRNCLIGKSKTSGNYKWEYYK